MFGQDAYTDLDFADDISLLAELLSLLIPVLEAFAEEAAAIGVVNVFRIYAANATGFAGLDPQDCLVSFTDEWWIT